VVEEEAVAALAAVALARLRQARLHPAQDRLVPQARQAAVVLVVHQVAQV
jgi:hypothetical protein